MNDNIVSVFDVENYEVFMSIEEAKALVLAKLAVFCTQKTTPDLDITLEPHYHLHTTWKEHFDVQPRNPS